MASASQKTVNTTKAERFNLHGIRANTIIDQLYTMVVNKETNQIHWNGFGKTNVIKNPLSNQWEIVEANFPYKVFGYLQETADSEFYPFGVKIWNIFADTNLGMKNNSKVKLLFSSCSKDEFACFDSSCVELKKRCDHFSDCPDKSDEDKCKVLSITDETYTGYEVNFPTLPGRDELLNLDLSVDIDQVISVKDLDLKFLVKLTIQLEWFDVQLK